MLILQLFIHILIVNLLLAFSGCRLQGLVTMANASTVVFRQLIDKESSTFTYILGCPETKKAVIVDPVLEQVKRDLEIAEQMGLDLELAINTHCHADHISGESLRHRGKI